jgi:hypothetical protein
MARCPGPVPSRFATRPSETIRSHFRIRPRAALYISSRHYGLGEAEGEGEAEGDGVGEGEAVGDGEAVRSVVSGPVEGIGVVVMVGSVRSVVRCRGSYGPLSDTDKVIPTTTAAIATTGVSTTTRGTRTNGRTHPSKKYQKSTATTASTATDSHHGYPKTNGLPATPPRLSAAASEVYRACISSSVSHSTLDLWQALSDTEDRDIAGENSACPTSGVKVL